MGVFHWGVAGICLEYALNFTNTQPIQSLHHSSNNPVEQNLSLLNVIIRNHNSLH